jgi:small subunit ribosomal protein S1
LAVDPERERISLGIKQLEQDPFSNFVSQFPKGSLVTGQVKEVEAKGAVIDLGESIEGYLRASEFSNERIEDARQVMKVGESVEAKIVGTDRKKRMISLSIKAKDAENAAVVQEELNRSANTVGGTTLGDLLKEQMANNDNDSDKE